MDTFFAPPERSGRSALQQEVLAASANPVIDALLKMAGGLVAVLNQRRQILAVNDAFLDQLPVKEARNILGLRPGEALGCRNAPDAPNGCGTGQHCANCGAALAIVSSLGHDRPVERICAIAAESGGINCDLYLRVKACPIPFNQQRLVLLFLQDITQQQQWAALGRVFFHDINNLISVLVSASELLTLDGCDKSGTLVNDIYQVSLRLAKEVEMQRLLTDPGNGRLPATVRGVAVQAVLAEIHTTFTRHPAAGGKVLDISPARDGVAIRTDHSLLLRVLGNMVTNALEASEKGDTVRLWTEAEPEAVTFHVWNRQPIAPAVRQCVFQRNVSTRPGPGRGLGAYAMKLFGEQYLGGAVTFDSTEVDGTRFSFRLPTKQLKAEGSMLKGSEQPIVEAER